MKKKLALLCCSFYFCFPLPLLVGQANKIADGEEKINQKFCQITDQSEWKLAHTIKLNFAAYHPQGLVKLGRFYFLSAVQTIVKPEKYLTPLNGYDRSPGKGVGFLFKFDEQGDLLAEACLGDSMNYHPGGIDCDGKYLWIPVAEYRPNSKTYLYRVHPDNLTCQKIFSIADHIGAVACDTEQNRLIGVNWGARRFYSWEINFQRPSPKVKIKHGGVSHFTANNSFYIDYQDCHFVGNATMLCSGLKHYEIEGIGTFTLGGLELINLKSFLPLHQIPISLFVRPNLVMSNNPFFVEVVGNELIFYFIPEDNESHLYIYNVKNLL